ncbi:hypothetical protein JDM601_2536 [Mycolicibacter sinensis]|uniref:Uncharacterized protein n=1 Tax=Mycolicibacter sinensis (strain JDM601) TaxID=875328 RepID=F5YWT1_MYCSD|nr:hypothetical protein JDM601_2536 [Mycolicibacter sinensis]
MDQRRTWMRLRSSIEAAGSCTNVQTRLPLPKTARLRSG